MPSLRHALWKEEEEETVLSMVGHGAGTTSGGVRDDALDLLGESGLHSTLAHIPGCFLRLISTHLGDGSALP